MPEPRVLRLALHVGSTGGTTETLERHLRRIDGVETIETRALRPARSVDAQSVATTLVIITATTKAGVTVAHHLEELIATLKRIANETGITNLLVEVKRRKVGISQLEPSDIETLADESPV
jgi:phosphopantetheine adenylyltransferase